MWPGKAYALLEELLQTYLRIISRQKHLPTAFLKEWLWNYTRCIRLSAPGTYIQVTRMIGSGNGLRKNPVLCEIIEEIFGIKLILAEYEEEAATGAAISSTLLKSIERAK